MPFCSRSCTRGCCGVPSELPHDTERPTTVYREMAADFVKYSSHPVVVVHRVPPARYNICPGRLFPDYSRDPAGANFGGHSMVTRILVRNVWTRPQVTGHWRGEYFTLKSLCGEPVLCGRTKMPTETKSRISSEQNRFSFVYCPFA